MASYISLINFTQQGLQNIHESPHRAAAFKTAAKKAGVKIKELYWTLGEFDGAILFEARDDETATGLTLALAGLGNVHSRTLRAFDAAEFAQIMAKSPKI